MSLTKPESPAEPVKEPRRSIPRFYKVLAVVIVLIALGGLYNWYSTTPSGNLEIQNLSMAWSQWSASLAPPTPNVHPGLIHPSQGPNESVFFFATTSPTVGTYAMEQGDTMFGDSLTVYAFTPLAHKSTNLTLTSYSPTFIYVKDPKTNFTSIETQYNIVNSTTSVAFPALSSFDSQSVDLPVTSQTQLVKVSVAGVEVFEFYHHTYPSYLAVPPATQGELFAQTEEYVLGTLVIAGLALALAAATAKRTGYIPAMGRYGWSGAIALVIMGFGLFYEYQSALTIKTVPYTLIPSFVSFYFIALQMVKPPTNIWRFERIDTTALTPTKHPESLEIIPSTMEESEPRVATNSWRDFILGRYITLRFIKEERELEGDDDSFENERILLQTEYWKWDTQVPGYFIFNVKEDLRLHRPDEEDPDRYYRVVLASPHMKEVEEFMNDLRTVDSLAEQKYELIARLRYEWNNEVTKVNKLVGRALRKILVAEESRGMMHTQEFLEDVAASRRKEDVVKTAGAEATPKEGGGGQAPK